MKIKKFLTCLFKIVVMAVIFTTMLTGVTRVLWNGVDRITTNSIKGFYEEEKNTLDAVYVGSSTALAYWNPMYAWEEYGIAVSTFASNDQPLAAAQYIIGEARKTQKDAVFIVNINTLAETTNLPRLHKVFSFAKPSYNKFKNINRISNLYGFNTKQRTELYFPIIRFHSRWNELTPADFNNTANGYNGALYSRKYFSVYEDVTKRYEYNKELLPLDDVLTTAVTDLLDYCDEEKIKVVFATVPQAKKAETIGKFNSINKMISDRGYPVLDFTDKTDELNIFTHKDYYNDDHTNIHGSLKYTYYLSQYLIDKYGFEDKRNNEEYESWNEGLKKYQKLSAHSILDLELDANYDPTTLEEPKGLSATADSEKITIFWDAVEGADGYKLYGKLEEKGNWTPVGTTTELSFEDFTFVDNGDYFYRVVPFRTNNDENVYGDFSYEGVAVKAGVASK